MGFSGLEVQLIHVPESNIGAPPNLCVPNLNVGSNRIKAQRAILRRRRRTNSAPLADLLSHPGSAVPP
jgi:hypothetical protein